MLIELTEKEKKILWFIVKNPGNSQKQICDKLKIAISTMSYFLNKIESLKLIIRYKKGRENRIHPTNKTIELFRNLFKNEHREFKDIDSIKIDLE